LLTPCSIARLTFDISSWYKREEQARRFAVIISAAILSGAIGGPLAGAITGGLEGEHGLRGCHWRFVVEGIATIGWAAISVFIILDFSANSNRLSTREKEIAIARSRQGGVTVRAEGSARIGKGKSFLMAVQNWKTWAFVVRYMVGLY
jgi:MFS family permease